MQQERWAQVQDVFNTAMEMNPRDRPPYLDRVCAADRELREEVDSLLGAIEESDQFLETPAWNEVNRNAGRALLPGDRVHHYEILSVLGVGGMGEVYLALDTRLNVKLLSRSYRGTRVSHANICIASNRKHGPRRPYHTQTSALFTTSARLTRGITTLPWSMWTA